MAAFTSHHEELIYFKCIKIKNTTLLTQLCARVGIFILAHGKQLNDRIISLREGVFENTSLTPPLVIVVHGPSH